MNKSQYILVAVLIVAGAALLFANRSMNDGTSLTGTSTATSSVLFTIGTTTEDSSGGTSATVTPAPAPAKAQPRYEVTEIVPVTRPAPVVTVENATLRLGETKTVSGVTITVKSIKDTRCTGSTSCAESGDARVVLGVKGPVTSKNVSLTEQQGFMIDERRVALTNVLPDRGNNETIPDANYQFFLTIESFK